MSPPRARPASWAGALLALTVATAVMLAARDRLSSGHVVVTYLLIVQAASATAGRTTGITVALVAFLLFDVLFLKPYGTLVIRDPMDWLVLAAFLMTALVSAQLLYRAQARAAEIDRLATLEEAHRAKDAVLASVSHDLRTPLTTIKGLAHEIANESGDDRAGIIEEEADRLTRFVGSMLDLSRITSGAAVPDVQPNEAEDLIGAALQQAQGRLGGREIRVTLDEQHPLLFGRFDFAETLRALVNLLDNAAKFSPPDSRVELSVARVADELRFVVSDHGPGIDAEHQRRMFDPFVSGTELRRDGAGLGLTIARGIAEAQGGSLRYEARAGGGSVFTLSVPAVDLEAME